MSSDTRDSILLGVWLGLLCLLACAGMACV